MLNKELEALENLKTAPSFMGGTEKYRFSMNSVSVLLEDYELVKQALTELQAIKEAKPSEALKLVDKMWQHLDLECLREIGNEGYTTIKQSLMKQLSGSQYTNIAIDEAVKPSEAMKCLIGLEKEIMQRDGYITEFLKIKFNIIKQALIRLEGIENTKPSEALEKLAILASEMGTSKDMKFAETKFPKMLLAVQQSLLKAQEQEKVLEIIKKCVMPLVSIDDDCVWDNEGYEYLCPKKEDLELLKRWSGK